MLKIPVSINEDSIGKPLPTVIKNDIIESIIITIDGKVVNFIDIIKNRVKFLKSKHKDNTSSFDKGYKFYLLKDRYDYVLAVKV